MSRSSAPGIALLLAALSAPLPAQDPVGRPDARETLRELEATLARVEQLFGLGTPAAPAASAPATSPALQILEDRLETAEAGRLAAVAERDRASRERDRLQESLRGAAAARSAMEAGLADLRERVAAAESGLAQTLARLDEATAENRRLAGRLEDLAAEGEELSARLERTEGERDAAVQARRQSDQGRDRLQQQLEDDRAEHELERDALLQRARAAEADLAAEREHRIRLESGLAAVPGTRPATPRGAPTEIALDGTGTISVYVHGGEVTFNVNTSGPARIDPPREPNLHLQLRRDGEPPPTPASGSGPKRRIHLP